jgi:hypothetical protein
MMRHRGAPESARARPMRIRGHRSTWLHNVGSLHSIPRRAEPILQRRKYGSVASSEGRGIGSLPRKGASLRENGSVAARMNA